MRKQILIFDDDVDLLNICTLVLAHKDFDIITSNNSSHLFEFLEQHIPSLIIMDCRIPGMGGVEAVQLLKADDRFQHVPVILFSGNDNIAELAKEAGADFYLSKPFDISELENMVDEALAGKLPSYS